MEKVSPFYAHYTKGLIQSESSSIGDLRLAVENFEKCLKYQESEQIYDRLLACYVKLNEKRLFEKTLVKAARSGFRRYYSSCGLLFAHSSKHNNTERALWWFNKGMSGNDPRCFAELGELYAKGCKAIKKDTNKAIEILGKGLDLRDPNWDGRIHWLLGMVYLGEEDYKTAAICFQASIASGYMDACYQLALLYRDGLGVKKSTEKYIEYLAKRIDKQSASELGSVYLTNEYTVSDKMIAYKYFAYAGNKGEPGAALLAAALLIDRHSDEKALIDRYINIAYRFFKDDKDMEDCYEAIDHYFDKSVGEKLRNMAPDKDNTKGGVA